MLRIRHKHYPKYVTQPFAIRPITQHQAIGRIGVREFFLEPAHRLTALSKGDRHPIQPTPPRLAGRLPASKSSVMSTYLRAF